MEIVSPHGKGLGALFDSGKTEFRLSAYVCCPYRVGNSWYCSLLCGDYFGENIRWMGRKKSPIRRPNVQKRNKRLHPETQKSMVEWAVFSIQTERHSVSCGVRRFRPIKHFLQHKRQPGPGPARFG